MSRSITNLMKIAALATIAAACDNPVRPEHHHEVGGVAILDAASGDVLAQSIGANQPFDNAITLELGTPLEVEILFLDADDPDDLDHAFHPHADEGESLFVDIVNNGIVTYHDHGELGDFEPAAVGQTTAKIELRHGDHADFRSGDLTIIVQ